MSTEPFTDADVQLVAEEIRATDCNSSSDAARAILAALAEAGRLTPDGAAPAVIAGWPVPSVYVQWKGTDACLDFHCVCGTHGHVDADFVYGVKCSSCGRVYTLPDTLMLTEGEPANELVHGVETRPWVEADEDSTPDGSAPNAE